MGPTAILSKFTAATTYDDVPAEAGTAALRQVLDCIGVALAAADEPPGRIIRDITRETGGTPEARLIGWGIATSSIQAAWANGALCHLLDYDDTGFSHPTACILPAALTAAEREHADGRAFITAMVVGYEVFERLSFSARPYEPQLRGRGYHPTSLYGAPAAAAAAGSLLGLNADQMAVALGLAAASTSGLTQHFGTWGKGVQAGTAARAGVTAALMAEKGYWGSNEVLEGRYGFFNAIHGKGNFDLSQVGNLIGQQWAILDPGLTVKSYPACGAVLRAVDAALELRDEHQITFEQVERVEVDIDPDVLNTVRYQAPTKGFQGKFSLDYCVAAAVLDGRVDLDSFSDEYCSSPRMREALGKTKLVLHPEWSDDPDNRRKQPVTIYLQDGHSMSKEIEHPRGSLQNPMTRDELLAKYRSCASRMLSQHQVEESITLIENIKEVGDIATLIEGLISDIPSYA